MPRKIFITLFLIFLAAVGIYAIAVLSGRVEVPERNGIDKGITKEAGEVQEPGPIEQVKKALNLEKPNDIVFGEVNAGTTLIILESVKIEHVGFVVVYEKENPRPENVLGFSPLLQRGATENVPIRLKRFLTQGETIYAGFRLDDGDGFFEISGRYDTNVSRADGGLILHEARVN